MILGQGASEESDEPQRQWEVAQWVWDLLASGYGPGGGWTLLDDRLLRPSAALRELPSDAPELTPYRRLMADLSAHAGDQVCMAGLLAAGLVLSLDGQKRMVGVEALRLARRQCLSWIDAHAETSTPGEAGRDVYPPLGDAWDGLMGVAEHEHLDLRRIDVRGADVPAPAWSDGLVLDASDGPGGQVRVLLVASMALPKPRSEASMRLTRGDEATAWQDAAVARMRQTVQELGADLVVCRKDIPEALAGGLALNGVQSVSDAPASLARRIEAATGARPVPDLATAGPSDLGKGVLRRRPLRQGGWLLSGAGPSATLEIPALGPAKEAHEEAAERWLRMAGQVIEDPRILPGGGHWQRDLARSLRDVAPHAPGSTPIGLEAVAKVFDRIADRLMRNLGKEPMDERAVDGVVDPACCVRMAVAAAFDLAIRLGTIDGRFMKRSSRPADLRGGLGPAGSPKGMPGDIPPLM